MKMLVLAVLLAVAQAPHPIPWQAPDSSTEDSRKPQNSAEGGQNPALPTRPSAKANNEPPGHPTTCPNEHQGEQDWYTVNITNPVPVPVLWGWREWMAWGANPTLAFFGFLGIGVGIASLRVVWRQGGT